MILTKAIAGIARSGATRSGWPVLVGFKVPLYALSNVARSGATRSNYIDTSRTFISVGGIQVGSIRPGAGVGVLIESLTVDDSLSSTPTTGALTAYGWIPVEGADVVITLGSKNNLRREFGGTILKTRHRYAGDYPIARNMLYDSALIDYAWGLQRRKVSGRFKATTVGAIAVSLMTSAPVGYTLAVEGDIAVATIDEITFTETNLDDAIGQLAKRVGGDWQCDYLKVVRVFFTDTVSTPPAIVNTLHRSMAGITWDRDLSQVVTRVYVDAGGSDALEAIAPGELLIPVATAAWYPTTGGVVLAGPQRVQYAGVVVGGGGSLVGPGASPTGAPNVTLQPGAGVDIGTHEYAVTFTTPSGETIPGPRVTVPVGLFLAPPTAPTPGTAGPGATGPDPGVHDYAVSFVISTGETVPGPRVVGSTGMTTPPTAGPNATLGPEGPGPDFGSHDYAVTFATTTGETPASPIGASATTGGPINPPATAPTPGTPTTGGSVDAGDHQYGVAFVTAYGETTVGPLAGITVAANQIPNPGQGPIAVESTGEATNQIPIGTQVFYAYAWQTATAETLMSTNTMIVTQNVSGMSSMTYVQGYGSQDARCTQVAIYRRIPTYGPNSNWALFTTTANNITGGPTASIRDNYNAFGKAPASSNMTDPNHTVPVSNIPRGSANVIARKLYRSVANTFAMHLVVTIGDNTTTSYTDTLADAALGAGAQGTNTALGSTAILVSSIARGPTGEVTARKLYRRSAGAGLRLVATIGDNSASTYTDTTPNASLGAAPPAANSATLRQIPLSKLPIGNSLVLSRKIYRTIANAGGGQLKLVATVADNVTTDFLDTVNDAALGAAALTVGTAQAAQAQLTAIPLGAASVTTRKVYRTKAGLAQLQLLTTIADNVTTVWTDIAPDASLGVNAPTGDTSTLKQPEGNVLAGSATLPCASVAAFRAAGGWAIVASQILRYTGISGNAITGIPATGPGAITATITFNTTAVAAPLLTGIPATGVGAIRVAIVKGDAVDLFIQEDDVAAQTALAAQLGGGADGIVEDEIQDRRLSATEARARARARLALLAERDADGKVGLITVHYTCRDINTRAGATVTINLGPPINLRGDFLIQRVTITAFGNPHVPPTYSVEASSARFTFEELLRVIREAAA